MTEFVTKINPDLSASLLWGTYVTPAPADMQESVPDIVLTEDGDEEGLGSSTPMELSRVYQDGDFVVSHRLDIPNFDFFLPEPIPFESEEDVNRFVENRSSVFLAFAYPDPDNTTEPDFYPMRVRAIEHIARQKRNVLLLESDWTQTVDAPLSEEMKTQWQSYRNQLRDITTHSTWPHVPEEDWPTKPQ